MTHIKIVAWIMLIFTIFALGFVGYIFFTTNISIESIDVNAQLAKDQEETFFKIAKKLSDGAFVGTVLSNEDVQNIEEYIFLTYTIKVKNNTFLKADMLEIQIIPNAQDVVQISTSIENHVDSKNTKEIKIDLLTKTTSNYEREMIITYYLWGKSHTIRINTFDFTIN